MSKKSIPVKSPDLPQLLAEIKTRALELYLDRSKHNEPGNDLSDWLKAEEEIKRKYGMKK